MKIIYHYTKLNYIFWERVATSTVVTDSSLGIFRWIFGIFLILFNVPFFGWISQAPNAFFNPPYLSLANLFNEFPGDLFFYILNILIIISVFFLTLGIKARFSSWLLLIAWLIGNNFQFAFGKIDHGSIMILALLLCMNFSNWGTYYALIPDKKLSRNSSKKALALLSVLLAFAMFTAGFEKALNWIDFDFSTGGFMSWFYPGYYNLNRTDLLAPVVLELPKWIFEFVDYIAVVFELSGFIALLSSKKWWLSWLFVACLFHFSNILLLNIPFNNHFAVYLAFVDFSQIRIMGRGSFSISKQAKFFLSGLVFVLCFTHFLPRVLGQNFNFFPGANLYVGIFIWILAAVIIFIDLLAANKKSAVQVN